jgi:predicted transcriptional regulator
VSITYTLADKTNRMKIARSVTLSPGIHLRELQRVVGLSFATIRYHTVRLVKDGTVERFPQGRYERLFPRGFSDSEKAIVSATRGNSSRLILGEIVRQGVVSNKEVSGRTGLAKSTVTKYLHLFSDLGIVSKSMSPQGGVLYATPNTNRVTRLLKFSEAGLLLAIDNYTELWDF